MGSENVFCFLKNLNPGHFTSGYKSLIQCCEWQAEPQRKFKVHRIVNG